MSAWTFANLTQETPATPFSALGASGLNIVLQSQAISKATFSVPTAFDNPFLAGFGDLVVIAQDGVARFVGNVTKPSCGASGAAEHLDYEISCPWWWLAERIIFRQYWLGRGNYPRVILGQNYSGLMAGELIYTTFTAGGQIKEILDWAISCGAPFQYATPIPDGPTVPFTERVCITCAEALKICLRWMGSVSTCWDFTTTRIVDGVSVPCPTLNFVPRVTMSYKPASGPVVPVPSGPVKLVTIGETRLQGIPNIAAAYTRLVPSVCLYYETKNSSNDGNSTLITEDFYPPTATGLEPGALVQAMELSGSQAHYEKQQIVVAPWPAPSNDPAFAQYIWETQPAAQQVLAANVAYYGNTAFAVPLPGLKLDGVTQTNYGIGDLANELLQGNITPWMESVFNIKHGKVQFGLMVYYTGTSVSPDYTAAMQIFGGIGPGYAQWIFCEKRCTNAVSQLYQYLNNYTSPETVPAGIAEMLYNTLSQLNWTGTIDLMEQECAFDIGLGNLINIAQGNAAWQTMLAPPQSISYDIDKGATAIKLGLPEHLGFTDYVDLLKSARFHVSSEKVQERADNKGESTQQLDGTNAAPHTFSTPPAGGGKPAPQNYALVDASSGGVAYFKVLNGNHKEVATGITWVPNNINTPIAATGSTLAYFQATINSSGAMSALTIVAGTNVPADTATNWYQLIGIFSVSGGVVIPAVPQGGVTGSQMYQYCGGAQCWLQ